MPWGSCCCMHACGAACSCIFGLLRHSHPPPMSVAAMPAGCRQLAAPSQGGTPVSHTKITEAGGSRIRYGYPIWQAHPCLQHHPSPYAAHRKLAHFLPLQSGGASPLANTPASWNRISNNASSARIYVAFAASREVLFLCFDTGCGLIIIIRQRSEQAAGE